MSLIQQQSAFLAGGGGSPYLFDIIQELGLTAGLINCLDPADARCYDGASQTLTDIAGIGNFVRGNSASAAGNDPTFAGTVGAPDATTYFSLDGGDFFSDASGNVPATDHWCNTGALWTILGLWYLPNFTGNGCFFGNRTDGSFNVHLRGDSSERIVLIHNISNGGGTSTETSTITFPTDSWSVIGAAYNNGAPSFDVVVNGNSENVGATTSTRTTSNASVAENTIGANFDTVGTPNTPLPNGSRLGCHAMWDGVALSIAQMSAVRERLKARRIQALP